MKIETLQQFYELMFKTKSIREKIVEQCLKNQDASQELINSLKEDLTSLENIPKMDGKHSLSYHGSKSTRIDITYEIEELKKDIYYLEHTEKEFYSYLEKLNPNFSRQVEEGVKFLGSKKFNCFITDRDGTVNNYCGRYKSSIQSVYNAIFLTRFANKCADNSIILTSAPLDNIGLVDIGVSPKDTFIYAGSKGREYFDKSCQRRQFPIESERQKILDLLNQKLTELVKHPEYEIFSLIGSGLQFKFGQTTIARQDIYDSISKVESKNFLDTIKNLINGIDTENKYFRIEDTGKDIEIILTIEKKESSDALKDFDKGDGIKFLNQDLNLNMEKGSSLICGDTKSDIPMVITSMNMTKGTWSVFVTEDEKLKEEVKKVCKNLFFVSKPDILVTILNELGKDK